MSTNFVQTIMRIADHCIDRIRTMYLDEIIGDGGARLYSKNKKWYYNGSEIGTGAGGMSELKDDTTPQLGGNLDCNGKDVTNVTELKGTSTGNVVITIDDGYALVIQKQSL